LGRLLVFASVYSPDHVRVTSLARPLAEAIARRASDETPCVISLTENGLLVDEEEVETTTVAKRHLRRDLASLSLFQVDFFRTITASDLIEFANMLRITTRRGTGRRTFEEPCLPGLPPSIAARFNDFGTPEFGTEEQGATWVGETLEPQATPETETPAQVAAGEDWQRLTRLLVTDLLAVLDAGEPGLGTTGSPISAAGAGEPTSGAGQSGPAGGTSGFFGNGFDQAGQGSAGAAGSGGAGAGGASSGGAGAGGASSGGAGAGGAGSSGTGSGGAAGGSAGSGATAAKDGPVVQGAGGSGDSAGAATAEGAAGPGRGPGRRGAGRLGGAGAGSADADGSASGGPGGRRPTPGRRGFPSTTPRGPEAPTSGGGDGPPSGEDGPLVPRWLGALAGVTPGGGVTSGGQAGGPGGTSPVPGPGRGGTAKGRSVGRRKAGAPGIAPEGGYRARGSRERVRAIEEAVRRAAERAIATHGEVRSVSRVVEEARRLLPLLAPELPLERILDGIREALDEHLRDTFRTEGGASFDAARQPAREPVPCKLELSELLKRLKEVVPAKADPPPARAPDAAEQLDPALHAGGGSAARRRGRHQGAALLRLSRALDEEETVAMGG
jgi:hypothetical protein